MQNKTYGQAGKVDGFPNDKLTTGSLDSQFVQLINISRTQGQFKMIRRPNLEQVRRNVSDTLKRFEKALNDAQATAEERNQLTKSLQDSVTHLNKTVRAHQESENTISFLGIAFSKDLFKGLFAGVTLALLAGIFILIQRLKISSSVARDSKSRVEEIQEEYDQHRKKALEKEQKLMRQLQDEINKRGGF